MTEERDGRPPPRRGRTTSKSSRASRFVVRNLQRRHRVDGPGLKRFLGAVAEKLGTEERSVTVALVGDARIRALNREFRGYDKPTDVLSFAADDEEPSTGGRYLGDIVISVETAERQARRLGSRLPRELRILTLHGFLHLLGYDHETDEGEMRRLEYRLRRTLGITRPRRADRRRRGKTR